jgi:hypothetical protein
MDVRGGSGVNRIANRPVKTLLYIAAALGICFSTVSPASALPAFARKYGMPCSSCHEAWPKLSPFGQQFKDNGYQMGNDRDAPIFQSPAYWPVTFRITPQWHRESTNKVAVDQTATGEAQVTTHGFDWSGLDFHTAGTLAKDFSFYVLPSSDNTGAFHFEAVWARLDNIAGSSWLNIKLGKFELDNLLSEKRILTLTSISGVYTNYHFQPMYRPGVPENPNFVFGIGDNQVGVEWLGHSKDDRTRVSASLLSSNDGSPGLPTSRGYDGFFAASRAFQLGSLGLQRVGGFAYIGQAPTYFQYTSGGPDSPVPGTGIGNKGYQRYGLIGMWYIKKFDITTIYFHGTDSAWLASNTAAVPGATLPLGTHSPSWNGGLFESHYNLNPQLIFINRYELVRMSQQAFTGDGVNPANPSNLGNTDVLTFGMRYYPFISSRAGFAYHAEYAIIRQRGASPVTATDLTSSSLLLGMDFDF